MKKVLFLLSITIFFSCQNDTKSTEILDTDYKKELLAYRLDNTKSRKNGYLQLAGLYKLKDSISSFGKANSNPLMLEIDRLPDTIGTFRKLNKKLIQFIASKDVDVVDEKNYRFKEIMLILDENGNSNQLFYNDLKWQIITRANGPYLRVWDAKNPAIDNFKGFKYYDINPNLILEGHLTYYEKPKSETVKSQLGVNANTNFVGCVTFKYNNTEYTLDVGGSGFIMVGDETTGDTTYGGGRYIYIDMPKENGPVMIDFNKLYNPPCSFSKYTTCLYPPTQNFLPFKIEAGEKIALK